MKKTDAVSQSADRLPYAKPVLKTYGPVAEITNTVDMSGAKDGSGNSRT
jgi:hypothetical protein